MPNENIDFLTDNILNSENPFVLACKKIKAREDISSYLI